MRKLTLSLVLTLFSLLILHGQNPDEYSYSLLYQLKTFPQEKIYVHTDKNIYVSGETIWYRAHIADAAFHSPSDIGSRYIYIELISPSGELIERSMLRPDVKGVFSNNLELPSDLPEGVYLLRAYTRFMLNRPEYLFEKKISVSDPMSSQVHVVSDFRKSDGNHIEARFLITDNKENPITPDLIRITIRNSAPREYADYSRGVTLRLDDGDFHIITLEFNHNDRLYRKHISIPDFTREYDLAFFPEGGHMLAGRNWVIGFKALNSEGLAEEVEIDIIGKNEEKLLTLKSNELGMGSFIINAETGAEYKAICRNIDGIEKEFMLPKAMSDKYGIKVQSHKDMFFIEAVRGDMTDKDKELKLLIHSRGLPVFENYIEIGIPVMINKDYLPSGVSQALLLDDEDNILSERIFFIYNEEDMGSAVITADKENYEIRDLVNLDIDLRDIVSIPLSGIFSVSVTDNSDVSIDTTRTIISELLLNSEIRGHIENPGYYFSEREIKSRDIDYLMLTQGWRRYNMTAIVKNDIESPIEPLEVARELSGKVNTLVNKRSISNLPVFLIAPSENLFTETQTDSSGRFTFSGLEHKENTMYQLQAYKDRVELIVDESDIKFADKLNKFYFADEKKSSLFQDYIMKSDIKYESEYGGRSILLDAAIKTAERKEIHLAPTSIYSSSTMNRKIDENIIEMAKMSNSFMNILLTIPSLEIVYNGGSGEGDAPRVTCYLRGRGSILSDTPVLFIVDDVVMPDDFDPTTDIMVDLIASVEVMPQSASAILGLRGAGGAIIIRHKIGDRVSENVFNVKRITLMGHREDAEFYSPKYETVAQRTSNVSDLRTTIYWNPCVEIEQGKGSISFYTADANTTYSVVLEGISNEGHLVREVKIIERTK